LAAKDAKNEIASLQEDFERSWGGNCLPGQRCAPPHAFRADKGIAGLSGSR